jgi:protein TonB
MNPAAPRSSLAGAALLGSALVHAAAFVAFGPLAANGVRTSASASGPLIVHVALAPSPALDRPVPQRERSGRQATSRRNAGSVSPTPERDPDVSTPAIAPVRAEGMPQPPASANDGLPAAAESSAIVAVASSRPTSNPPAIEAPVPARYLHTPEPAYPASAREEGEEGIVILKVRISRSGFPEEIVLESSSGFRELDRAAIAGIRRWSFIPARRGDEPIEAWMQVPIRFRLG